MGIREGKWTLGVSTWKWAKKYGMRKKSLLGNTRHTLTQLWIIWSTTNRSLSINSSSFIASFYSGGQKFSDAQSFPIESYSKQVMQN